MRSTIDGKLEAIKEILDGKDSSEGELLELMRGMPYSLFLESNNKKNLFIYAAEKGYLEIINQLSNTSEIEFFIKSTDEHSRNPFMLAATKNNLEVVKKLYELYPHYLHSYDDYGNNAFIHAAVNGNWEVIEYILELDSNLIKYVNKRNINAFLMAVMNGHIKVVENFLNKDTDLILSKDNAGNNALMLAILYDKSVLAQQLKNYKQSLMNDIDESFFCKVADDSNPNPLHIALDIKPELLDTLDSNPQNTIERFISGYNNNAMLNILNELVDRHGEDEDYSKKIRDITSSHAFEVCSKKSKPEIIKKIKEKLPELADLLDNLLAKKEPFNTITPLATNLNQESNSNFLGCVLASFTLAISAPVLLEVFGMNESATRKIVAGIFATTATGAGMTYLKPVIINSLTKILTPRTFVDRVNEEHLPFEPGFFSHLG